MKLRCPLIALLIISVFCITGCNLLISSNRKIYFSPNNISLKHEEITLKNQKGISLRGWFVKTHDDKAPCIVFCEGNGQNRAYYLRFTKFLNEAGYNVFLFDYTGFGNSGGEASEMKFGTFIGDINIALDYIKTRPDVDNNRIGLFGWSMGAGLALYIAGQRNDIKVIMIDSSLYSFIDRFSDVLKKKIGSFLSYPIIGFAKLFYTKYEPIKNIKKIKNIPILFIHGTDDIFYYKEIIKLYEEYSGPKKIIIFPYAGHMENFSYYKEEYIHQVLHFLDIYMLKKPLNNYSFEWEYIYDPQIKNNKEGNTIITIKNFTTDRLPLEIRINTADSEYLKRVIIPIGTHIIEEKTQKYPTSVIVNHFVKNISISADTWDFFTNELFLLDFDFKYISKEENLINYARLATDPEEYSTYVEAVEKKNDILFLKNRRYLIPSIILANMMSPKLISIGEKLYSLKAQEMLDNLQLFNKKMISHPKILKNLHFIPKNSELWENNSGQSLITKEQTIDEMFAMKKISNDKIVGNSASIAFLNIALLRIMGVQNDKIFAIHLKSFPNHTITSFILDNEYYIFNNNLLFPGENISWPDKKMQILGIYNDALYLTNDMETNFGYKDLINIERFMKNVFKNFSWEESKIKKIELLIEPIYSPIKLGRVPISEITNKIQKEVFKKSAEFPISQYTYAKYAFQSLFVKKLEVYAQVSQNSYYLKNLMKKLKSINDIIKWSKQNLSNESIFDGNSRIMLPDEVIINKTGNYLDQALLLWAFLNNKGIKSWVILTEKDAYLAYKSSKINFFKIQNFKNVSNIKGEKIILIFNNEESYSKLAGVNRLYSEIKELIY